MWGAYRNTLNGYGGYAIQDLLALGLSKILEIARSETFEEKSRLVGGGGPTRRTNNAFLLVAFRSIYDMYLGDKKAAKAMRRLPPFFSDGDDGPESTWRHTLEERVYGFYTSPPFEWGCVMWDAERVDDVVIYEEREENPCALFDKRDTHDSFGARFDLYELGFRGYWDPDDESPLLNQG